MLLVLEGQTVHHVGTENKDVLATVLMFVHDAAGSIHVECDVIHFHFHCIAVILITLGFCFHNLVKYTKVTVIALLTQYDQIDQ